MPVFISILIFSVVVSYMGTSMYGNRNSEPIYNDYGVQMNISKTYAFAAFALVIFFAAMRYEFIDSSSYINEFWFLPTGLSSAIDALKGEDKSAVFIFVNILFKTFVSDNESIWLLAYALFHSYAVVRLFRLLSCDYTYTVFLFISSAAFSWFFNALRQMTAIAIMYLAITFIIEKKLWKFLIAVLIAYLFHQTAIIWIPMYFFVTGEPWGKKTGLFIFGTVTAVVFLSSFTSLLGSALEDTAYASATSNFSTENGVNPIRVAVNVIPTLLAFMRRNELKPHLTPASNLCINLSVISSCISFMGIFTDGIMVGRLPAYFSFCNWPLFPWIFKYGFSDGDGNSVKLACTVGYIAYFIYNILYADLYSYGSMKLDLWYNIYYM